MVSTSEPGRFAANPIKDYTISVKRRPSGPARKYAVKWVENVACVVMFSREQELGVAVRGGTPPGVCIP